MNLRRRFKAEIPLRHPEQANPVPIVSDGLIATGAVGEGQMVPVIVLDTSSRPDIEGVVSAHTHLGKGDVKSYWPLPHSWLRKRSTCLVLEFVRPSQCVVILEFDLEQQGVLVDQILYAEGLWIQPGRAGDRVGTLLDKPKLLVEVPLSREFHRAWEPVFEKAMIRRFRREGLSRPRAKRCGRKLITEWREMFHERMPLGSGKARSDDRDQG